MDTIECAKPSKIGGTELCNYQALGGGCIGNSRIKRASENYWEKTRSVIDIEQISRTAAEDARNDRLSWLWAVVTADGTCGRDGKLQVGMFQHEVSLLNVVFQSLVHPLYRIPYSTQSAQSCSLGRTIAPL